MEIPAGVNHLTVLWLVRRSKTAGVNKDVVFPVQQLRSAPSPRFVYHRICVAVLGNQQIQTLDGYGDILFLQSLCYLPIRVTLFLQ